MTDTAPRCWGCGCKLEVDEPQPRYCVRCWLAPSDRLENQRIEIELLRSLLRNLAEAVIDSVSNCEGVVSMDAENQARVVLEEVLPSAK